MFHHVKETPSPTPDTLNPRGNTRDTEHNKTRTQRQRQKQETHRQHNKNKQNHDMMHHGTQ